MNYYADVIGLLMSDGYTPRDLVIEIAKHHPKIVIDAANRLSVYPWMDEIDILLRADKKINAIKLWREKTGVGFKDAKDAVEVRQKELVA